MSQEASGFALGGKTSVEPKLSSKFLVQSFISKFHFKVLVRKFQFESFQFESFQFESFGSKVLVRKFWFESFGSKVLVRKFWFESFGSKVLVVPSRTLLTLIAKKCFCEFRRSGSEAPESLRIKPSSHR